MSDKNDGGPAFPRTAPNGGFNGMSTRTWLAGQFAAAWVVAISRRCNEQGYSDYDVIRTANKLGLEQADAMLKARET